MSVLGWRLFDAESAPTSGGGTYMWDGFNFPPGNRPSTKAGIIGDAASIVTVSAAWTSVSMHPTPYVDYSYSINGYGIGVIQINLTSARYGFGQPTQTVNGVTIPSEAANGLLELTVTVDGKDADNTLIIAMANEYGGWYGSASFGYGVGAPSSRWTNIRQAVEK